MRSYACIYIWKMVESKKKKKKKKKKEKRNSEAPGIESMVSRRGGSARTGRCTDIRRDRTVIYIIIRELRE